MALKTPPGTSDYQMYRDEAADPPALVCQVGSDAVCATSCARIDDLHAMLKKHGDWMPLGSADEQKPAADGTVEAWGRAADNPVGGWYGLRKGYRGRFGMYVPPLLEALGLCRARAQPQEQPDAGHLGRIFAALRDQPSGPDALSPETDDARADGSCSNLALGTATRSSSDVARTHGACRDGRSGA